MAVMLHILFFICMIKPQRCLPTVAQHVSELIKVQNELESKIYPEFDQHRLTLRCIYNICKTNSLTTGLNTKWNDLKFAKGTKWTLRWDFLTVVSKVQI